MDLIDLFNHLLGDSVPRAIDIQMWRFDKSPNAGISETSNNLDIFGSGFHNNLPLPRVRALVVECFITKSPFDERYVILVGWQLTFQSYSMVVQCS